MGTDRKSAGHVGFADGYEYYEVGGQVYVAPLANAFDVTTGARIGRWECSVSHFELYRDIFPAFDDAALLAPAV